MFKKKSQIWTIDLIAGITIFFIVIVMYFIFTNNISEADNSNLNELYEDSLSLSDTLLSSGSPVNWTYDNIEEIGLTNGNYRLNISKLQNMSQLDYSKLKLLLKTRYEYLIFFENKSKGTISLEGIQYTGKPGITKDNINELEKPESLITVRRFLIYNSEIITMVVYLWD